MLIGQGVYGCVYKPAIECDGEEDKKWKKKEKQTKDGQKGEYVSKVMKLDDAEMQVEEYQAVEKTGVTRLYPTFTVGKPKLCRAPKIQEKMLDKCRISRSRADKLGAIKYEYAGKALEDTSPMDEKHFAMLLIPLAKGLRHINQQGIFHSDIKASNITYDGKSLRLIDWGMSGTIQESISTIRPTYYFPYWPWDRILVGIGTKGSSPFARERTAYRRLREYLEKKYPRNMAMRSSEADKISAIINRYSIDRIVEQTYRTLDTYSLGATLTRMQSERDMEHPWKPWSPEFKEMVDGMTDFNPMSRWTWADVLHRLNNIADEKHVAFTKDTMDTHVSTIKYPKTIYPRKRTPRPS